jgi:hypothetical protein
MWKEQRWRRIASLLLRSTIISGYHRMSFSYQSPHTNHKHSNPAQSTHHDDHNEKRILLLVLLLMLGSLTPNYISHHTSHS